MQKLLVALFVVVAALTVVPTAASAVTRVTYELEDVTFPDPYLSQACGTDVQVTANGTLTALIIRNSEGDVVREVDTLTGTLTYSANGKSVTRPVAVVSTTEFPHGGAVGSPAVVTIVGVGGGTIVGGPPGAGRLVYSAVVVAVEDGVPLTAVVGGPEQATGNFDQATAAICAALT